jgi:hypothetical protein
MRNYSLMSGHGPSRHLALRSGVSGFGGKAEVADLMLQPVGQASATLSLRTTALTVGLSEVASVRLKFCQCNLRLKEYGQHCERDGAAASVAVKAAVKEFAPFGVLKQPKRFRI